MNTNKGVRNLFVYGGLFFFAIMIILTYDTMMKLPHRAPEITEEVNAGKMVWHKYDCIGCHTILGNGSYFAPDLTKTAQRKPHEYLKNFLINPKIANPKATMPRLGITEEEARQLVAFLDWISKVDTNSWPPKPILAAPTMVSARELSEGQRIYQSLNCSECHTINGIGGTMGTDLTHVGSKRDRVWLKGHFKDPQKYVPDSVMPPVMASDADIEHLTDYILTLK